MVTHPSANRTQRRATLFIETRTLPLPQITVIDMVRFKNMLFDLIFVLSMLYWH